MMKLILFPSARQRVNPTPTRRLSCSCSCSCSLLGHEISLQATELAVFCRLDTRTNGRREHGGSIHFGHGPSSRCAHKSFAFLRPLRATRRPLSTLLRVRLSSASSIYLSSVSADAKKNTPATPSPLHPDNIQHHQQQQQRTARFPSMPSP